MAVDAGRGGGDLLHAGAGWNPGRGAAQVRAAGRFDPGPICPVPFGGDDSHAGSEGATQRDRNRRHVRSRVRLSPFDPAKHLSSRRANAPHGVRGGGGVHSRRAGRAGEPGPARSPCSRGCRRSYRSAGRAVDEGIQWFLPNRVFDPVDMLFNLLAGATSVAAVVTLAWARRMTLRRRGQPKG